jgi:hypothetical protein
MNGEFGIELQVTRIERVCPDGLRYAYEVECGSAVGPMAKNMARWTQADRPEFQVGDYVSIAISLVSRT